jgi:hypothetical protein
MFDSLKSKANRQQLISLGLEAPAKPAGDAAPSPQAITDAMQKMHDAFKGSEASAELKRRAKELLDSGRHPDLICFLRERENQSPVALLVNEPPCKALLIYTSPVLAHFYLQTKRLPFEVVGLKLDEVATAAEDWRKRGFDAYIMDMSPKAPLFNIIDTKDRLITSEELVKYWAIFRTARNWQAQTRLHEFYGKKVSNPTSPEILQKHRAELETLRDYTSFDVPFVHWMIALIARMQGDEPGRLAATAVLESFGPAFVGRTNPLKAGDDVKVWAESLTTAHVGLMAEFGMLKGPDGSPVKSILRSEMTPVPEG